LWNFIFDGGSHRSRAPGRSGLVASEVPKACSEFPDVALWSLESVLGIPQQRLMRLDRALNCPDSALKCPDWTLGWLISRDLRPQYVAAVPLQCAV